MTIYKQSVVITVLFSLFYLITTTAVAQPVCGTPKSQSQLLTEWQTCAQQSQPAGCLTAQRVQDIICSTPNVSSSPDWVSIKDLRFGAVGDNIHDDTAAIQAAIDYAFANGRSGVYCPTGIYRTTSTIYLDPPGNLRTSFSSPTKFQFTMAFFGDPKSSGAQSLTQDAVNYPTCTIKPTFNNNIAFIVGPGQGMRVSDIAVVGPNNAYRGNFDPNGVGIGIAGGPGGASNTLIRDTFVRYFYALYKTDANNGCCLADSNLFDHVGGDDGYVGIRLWGTQSFINHINFPYFSQVTIAVDNEFSHQTEIEGGNLSSTYSASNSFTISGVSAGNCGAYSLCLTATVASPDANIPNVYDSFEILTPHFGLIPFSMTAWNSSTNVINLQAADVWETTNYGNNSYWFNNDIYGELNAATTLYASERLRVVKGVGVELDGTHIENDNACTTFFDLTSVWSGQASNEIRNPFFDYNISLPQNASQANKYCQQAFPFIYNPGYSLRLSGGLWNPSTGSPNYPLLFDVAPYSQISGSQLNGSRLFNFRFITINGNVDYGQIDTTNWYLGTVARGIGIWDDDYFLSTPTGIPESQWNFGELLSPFCGYEPCPSTTPNLSPNIYSLVSGSLGVLGTYPPIACRTVFKSLDWNTTALAHIFLRSASCPGWSWGQNLTDTNIVSTPAATINGSLAPIPATITWDTSTASNPGWTFSGGNLVASSTSTDNAYLDAIAIGTCVVPSKVYYEAITNTTQDGYPGLGFATSSLAFDNYLGATSDSVAWYSDGKVYVNGVQLTTISAAVNGDHRQIAIDTTASPPLFWGKNNTGNWNNNVSANPATGVGGIALTGLTTTRNKFYPAVGSNSQKTTQTTANFGATSYFGTLPSGFTSPCAPTSTLTVNSGSGTTIGQHVTGNGIATGTYILSGSGSSWIASNAQTIASETMNLYKPLTWNYSRGSSDLYLDSTTMQWMFNGLGFTLDNGEGQQPYIVTGIYPYLGYVTVIWAGNNSGNSGGNSSGLLGNINQVYSCASLCTIGQAPFNWLAY